MTKDTTPYATTIKEIEKKGKKPCNRGFFLYNENTSHELLDFYYRRYKTL